MKGGVDQIFGVTGLQQAGESRDQPARQRRSIRLPHFAEDGLVPGAKTATLEIVALP
jgi:hypothetical protein